MTSFYLDYPFQIGPSGRTASTDYLDHIRDLIEQLLFTKPGERVNRPDFGCGLQDLVFEPNSVELAAVLQVSAEAALQRWLGDVITIDALAVSNDEASLRVEVRYVVKATGTPVVAVVNSSAQS